jgi:uncharacterized membrane protein
MVELEPHKPGRRLDKHFRWRGTEVSRVEAIADAVFGLVLAMLLLKEHPPESFADLFTALKGLIPLAVTFTCIALIWFEHYLFFRRYDLHDGPSIALTFLLMFLAVAFAYPLKLLFTAFLMMFIGPIGELRQKDVVGDSSDTCPVFLVFALGFCAVYGTLALLYRVALRRQAELELDPTEVFLTRSSIAAHCVYLSVGLLSAALAGAGLVWPDSFIARSGIPGWILFLIGPLMTVHGTWQGRRLRQLGAG